MTTPAERELRAAIAATRPTEEVLRDRVRTLEEILRVALAFVEVAHSESVAKSPCHRIVQHALAVADRELRRTLGKSDP